MATEEEPEGQDGQEEYWSLAESPGISYGGHGVDMDCGRVGPGCGCTAPSGLHLHHHGGLPKGSPSSSLSLPSSSQSEMNTSNGLKNTLSHQTCSTNTT